MVSYQVSIPAFEGPFDLLLQLIARRRVEIADVDLADITGEFLASIARLDELDLETATHFLVVAATLVELKAARLLPEADDEDSVELLRHARDLLYARLLEFRGIRDASVVFGHLIAASAGATPREAPLEARFRGLVPDGPLGVDGDGLARLAAAVLAPRPQPHVDLAHVQAVFLSVATAAERLLGRLADRGEGRFHDLVAGLSRGDRIATFLAILELYRSGLVDLTQPDLRGELRITRRQPAGARDARR